MDGARGPLLPLTASTRLRGIQARWGGVSCHEYVGKVPAEALGWSLASGGGGLSGPLTDEYPV